MAERSVTFVAARESRRTELGRPTKFGRSAKLLRRTPLALAIAIAKPILSEASAQASLKRRVAARRIQKLGVHAAGVVLRAAAFGAWVGEGKPRSGKHEAHQDGGAHQFFCAPYCLNDPTASWSRTTARRAGQNKRGNLST